MAALSAGVTWLAAGPASADTCGAQLLHSPTVASVCEDITGVKATSTYGQAVDARPGGLAASTDAMAKQVGLPGLAKATAVLSFADMGGVAAASGLPALPAGVPGKAGLPDVGSLAAAPQLPGVPALTGKQGLTDLTGKQGLPVTRLPLSGTPKLPVSGMPKFPEVAGVTGGLTAPLSLSQPITLPEPIKSLQDGAAGTAPKVLDNLRESVPVQAPDPAAGVGGALKSLKIG